MNSEKSSSSASYRLRSQWRARLRNRFLLEWPVKHAVIDLHKFCAVYDDNYTLSAARAREARRDLIGTLDDVDARRLIVAGYGDSRPLPNLPPSDPRNRRVEVMFTVDAEAR